MNEFIKNKPNALNPYKEGARIILSRLLWDLNVQSIISRNKLNILKNKYVNNKAVIICNGPSLNQIDLNKLKNIYTINQFNHAGMNIGSIKTIV